MNAVTETELKARAVAPRVTEKELEANIASTHFFNMGGCAVATGQPTQQSLNLLTICVITLKNGFTVTGESACASPENYQKDIGERIAFENARNKIWPLMGYQLREELRQREIRHGAVEWPQPRLGAPDWLDGDYRRNGVRNTDAGENNCL